LVYEKKGTGGIRDRKEVKGMRNICSERKGLKRDKAEERKKETRIMKTEKRGSPETGKESRK
jgi:hypothetical protein